VWRTVKDANRGACHFYGIKNRVHIIVHAVACVYSAKKRRGNADELS
jgi:hypothetical protein